MESPMKMTCAFSPTSPTRLFKLLCRSCHPESLRGTGSTAEWEYTEGVKEARNSSQMEKRGLNFMAPRMTALGQGGKPVVERNKRKAKQNPLRGITSHVSRFTHQPCAPSFPNQLQIWSGVTLSEATSAPAILGSATNPC